MAGVVLGLERGWSQSVDGKHDPGIRTFSLVALLGGVLGAIDAQILAAIGFAAVAGVAMLGYRATSRRLHNYGYTTEIAVLVAYVCGLVAGLDRPILAMSVAVVSALTLGLKPELHRFVKHLKRLEVLSTIQLLVVAVVLLPLMPDEDTWLVGLNFRTIGWFVLLILGLSYLGYVSVRLFGDRLGIFLTAMFGGLTSSTAVTATFSRMAAREPGASHLLGAGILLACAVMPVRLLILTGVVNPALLSELLPTLGTLTVALVLAALIMTVRDRRRTTDTELSLANPFELKGAAAFAAFLTVLFVITPWLNEQFGATGLYLAALFSGATDVDAIGLTLAQQSGSAASIEPYSTAIFLAAVSNTLVKSRNEHRAVQSGAFQNGGFEPDRSIGGRCFRPLILTHTQTAIRGRRDIPSR